MKRLLLALIFFLAPFAAPAMAGGITIAWDSDPSPVVSGYRVYYGTQSGVYTNSLDVGLSTEVTLPDLVSGTTYYCVVTAYNSAGLESGYSEELELLYESSDPGSATFRISQLTFGTDELVTFKVEGMPGDTAEVYASGNLTDWELIGSYTLASGTISIRDPKAEGEPKRFYKLVVP